LPAQSQRVGRRVEEVRFKAVQGLNAELHIVALEIRFKSAIDLYSSFPLLRSSPVTGKEAYRRIKRAGQQVRSGFRSELYTASQVISRSGADARIVANRAEFPRQNGANCASESVILQGSSDGS